MRILAQARKELTQVLRDKLALALALLLPVGLMILMSSAISLTPTRLPVAVRDYDNSHRSRELIEAFRASLTFEVKHIALSTTPEVAFATSEVRAVIIIPESFGRDLQRSRQGEIQAVIDATDTNTATQIRGYLGQITRSFSPPPRQLVTLETRLFYNPAATRRVLRAWGVCLRALDLSPAAGRPCNVERE
ncbi:MAG: ABC transporter permease [Bryobacteraceae bacterium]